MKEKRPVDTLAKSFMVLPGHAPRLTDTNAGRTCGWEEEAAEEVLERNRKRLSDLQYKMYADGRYGMLIVLQAIDGGGKDGAVRRVFSAFNPQGCTVTSFKAPTSGELKHDYLWRVHQFVPGRGEIGVFNRSQYEDVLVPRVGKTLPKAVLERRYGQINDFERMLHDNDIRVVKFFLHIGKDEQKRRFEARLADPARQWKFDPADLDKRKRWNDYRKAYETMLQRCSTQWAPWYVIPADHKWFRNLALSQILLHELEKLPLRFPPLSYDPRKIRIR